MGETATLHFGLGHLAPDQPFTLRVGSRSYELAPHTRQTLAQARRSTAALAVLPDRAVTHFAGPVQVPGGPGFTHQIVLVAEAVLQWRMCGRPPR
jgi:hypothetical protein